MISTTDDIIITSPAAGTILTTGQHFTVSVSVKPNTKIKAIAIGGMGGTGLKRQPPFVFDLIAPEDKAARFSLVAVGFPKSEDDKALQSKSVSIDVRVANDDGGILEVSPDGFDGGYVGGQLTIGYVGLRFSDGAFINVKEASASSFTSADTNVATVDSHGLITAVGPGGTVVTFSYKDQKKEIPVSVKKLIRGDLDGDGRVTKNDLNRLLGAVGLPATCPNDARDLNHDGKIDEEDIEIMKHLIEEQNEKDHDKDKSHGKDKD